MTTLKARKCTLPKQCESSCHLLITDSRRNLLWEREQQQLYRKSQELGVRNFVLRILVRIGVSAFRRVGVSFENFLKYA